uniref:Uncharacterized protein n=1 Tax=Globodera rostochiensis TaxID=31243 RepID=A0A914HGS6_GLORO
MHFANFVIVSNAPFPYLLATTSQPHAVLTPPKDELPPSSLFDQIVLKPLIDKWKGRFCVVRECSKHHEKFVHLQAHSDECEPCSNAADRDFLSFKGRAQPQENRPTKAATDEWLRNGAPQELAGRRVQRQDHGFADFVTLQQYKLFNKAPNTQTDCANEERQDKMHPFKVQRTKEGRLIGRLYL